jgi:hypothetical protein
MATAARNGSTRAWRELRARAIRREIRANGAVYCRTCGKGPLDPDAAPGSPYAIDADHVAPVALGGKALPAVDGVRLTCPPCNRGEGRRIAEEKAHRERATSRGPRPRPTAHGFYDADGERWNPTTRSW